MRESAAWEHFNPVRVVCGDLQQLPSLVPKLTQAILVTTMGATRRGLTRRVADLLPGVNVTVFDAVRPNPDLEHIDAATQQLRGVGAEMIIAVGGGSVLDAAKALAITIPNGENASLCRHFRDGAPLPRLRRLSLVAIPTTSGTGSEVTPFATIWDHARGKKHSLAGPDVYPDVALLDASLTVTLGPDDTLFPGLDTISHALESLWNRNRTPFSQAFAYQALDLAAASLPALLEQPDDIVHRRRMQTASVLAGMAISQTRTALAHAISYPVTAHLGVPHGLACSFSLVPILEANLESMATSSAERHVLGSALSLLKQLNLPAQMGRFGSLDDVRGFEAEMFAPGRSENYMGVELGPLGSVLTRSFER